MVRYTYRLEVPALQSILRRRHTVGLRRLSRGELGIWLGIDRGRRIGQAGQAIPLIALLIIILIGMAGLVVDGGQLTVQYRVSQNAADSAALAAALQVTNGASESQASTAATVVAVRNQIPASDLSLAYYDSTGAQTSVSSSVATVAATVVHQFPTLFLPIVGINSASVAASATVSVKQGNAACVVCVMSPNATSALDMSGIGSLSLSGGNVQVNSTSVSAVTVGALAKLTVSQGKTYVVGGVTGSSGVSPAPVTGAPAVSDPFSSVPIPSLSSSGTCCPATLTPGIYSSIVISGNSTVTMNPGTYVVTGSISVAGNGSLIGHGVTIYLACSSYPIACATGQVGAPMSVTGNATVDFSAPSYGTYQGMTIFSDRKNTSPITFGGNGAARFVGSVYALAGTVLLSGNGSNSSVNSRVVANQVGITGSGTAAINYTQSANYVLPNFLTLTN